MKAWIRNVQRKARARRDSCLPAAPERPSPPPPPSAAAGAHRAALFMGVAALFAACSGGSDSGGTTSSAGTAPSPASPSPAPQPSPAPAPAPSPTPSPAPSPSPAAAAVDVLTWHNDNARTGQNLAETQLAPSTVAAATFGLLAVWSVDGKVDAQPLYVHALDMGARGVHDVLLVASEHDSVYAFDVPSGTVLWQVSLLGASETTSDTHGCSQVVPEIGITATPVIDRTAGTAGIAYVVAMSRDTSGNYYQRIHALDLLTGAEALGGPVTVSASVPGSGAASSGGSVPFQAGQYEERAALLLDHGVLYTAWTSHCDAQPYTGWVIGYNPVTLAQGAVLNITPNGSGGAFWGAGAGPATDAAGNLYLLAGNGTFDTTLTAEGFPISNDFGNAFLKLTPATTPAALSVVDYFATYNTVTQSAGDVDLGSGGAMVLPDLADASGSAVHLAVGAGKDGNIYVVSRDGLGHFSPSTNNNRQTLTAALVGGAWSSPAWFNGSIYYAAVDDSVKAFPVAAGIVAASPSSVSANTYGYPGATPSVSANGTSGGIVWTVENATSAVLHAHDASNVATELYNSSQSGTRDLFGAGNKFMTPIIANGRVFVGTPSGVAMFGLLP